MTLDLLYDPRLFIYDFSTLDFLPRHSTSGLPTLDPRQRLGRKRRHADTKFTKVQKNYDENN